MKNQKKNKLHTDTASERQKIPTTSDTLTRALRLCVRHIITQYYALCIYNKKMRNRQLTPYHNTCRTHNTTPHHTIQSTSNEIDAQTHTHTAQRSFARCVYKTNIYENRVQYLNDSYTLSLSAARQCVYRKHFEQISTSF